MELQILMPDTASPSIKNDSGTQGMVNRDSLYLSLHAMLPTAPCIWSHQTTTLSANTWPLVVSEHFLASD